MTKTGLGPLLAAAAVAALALVTLAAPAGAAPPSAIQFGPVVRVNPDLSGGYEPAVYGDRFGNLFATAHKENYELAISPDSQSPTATRSMSWDWMSADGGRTWKEIPGLPLNAENKQFGDEGDMALDDAGHLYFVDTNVTDVSFTRWKVSGLNRVAIETTRPILPAGQPVDDRPWITAHGDGHVFYFGNEGDKVTYPLGHGSGSGFGPGRYTVYRSTDGGNTFDPFGYTLKDSGWCRPAAQSGSSYVYAICTDDGRSNGLTDSGPAPTGTIYAYVSKDDGVTFERYPIASYAAQDSTTSWPTVAIAPDGTVYALYVDGRNLDANGLPASNRLHLFTSRDHGLHWSAQDITPFAARFQYGWLSISPDGRSLGIGIYSKPDAAAAWKVYGATFRPGAKPDLVSVDDAHPVTRPGASEANGDLMGSAFLADGRFNVIWTRREPNLGVVPIHRNIYTSTTVA